MPTPTVQWASAVDPAWPVASRRAILPCGGPSIQEPGATPEAEGLHERCRFRARLMPHILRTPHGNTAPKASIPRDDRESRAFIQMRNFLASPV